MASLNRVEIIGRLGRDPEVKSLSDGAAVCNFSVATTEAWKDKSGNKQEKTEWHRLVAFGKLADICGRYLSKGSLVYVAGKLQTRTWEDKSGAKKSVTEINVAEMQMLDAKKDGAKQEPKAEHGYANNGDEIPF